MIPSPHKLTDKQAKFCEEYLIDLNATQAAIRAGYSVETARNIASENMAKPDIAEYIAELQAERSKRTQIDADWVLNQSVKLHNRCMNEIEVFTDRRGVPILDDKGELQYVFNAAGAAKALELVGKHVNIQAFKEQVAHSGLVGIAQIPADKLSDEDLMKLAGIPLTVA